MLYDFISFILNFLAKLKNRNVIQVSTELLKSKTVYEINKTYRVFLSKSYLKTSNEIDKTLGFFNAELIAVSRRRDGFLFDHKDQVLSFERKGYDTNTGKKYIHYEDVLASEIKKLELVG